MAFTNAELLETARVKAFKAEIGRGEKEHAHIVHKAVYDDDLAASVPLRMIEQRRNIAETARDIGRRTKLLRDGLFASEYFITMDDGSRVPRPEAHKALLRLDESLYNSIMEVFRFEAHFQSLVIIGAKAARDVEDGRFRQFLYEKMGQSVSIQDLRKWTAGDRDQFKDSFRDWEIEQQHKNEDQLDKKRLEEEADRRRRRIFEEEQERRRKQRYSQQHQEIDVAEEERRKRFEKEEAERRREQQRREEEENRRLQALDEAEARRKMAEMEEQRRRMEEFERRRREEEEERRRKQDEIRQSKRQEDDSIQELNRIIEDARTTRQKFADPEFPANSRVLSPEGDYHRYGVTRWNRPEDWCDRPNLQSRKSHTSNTPYRALDVLQGQLGDCWFLSALSVVAERQPDLVDKLFVTKSVNEAGAYAVRFFKGGEWVTVVVDDVFPCDRSGVPAFARSENSDVLWPMILEKAYAKLHRSYEAIEGGLVHFALVDLTGGSAESVDLQKSTEDISNGNLWTRMKRYHQSGHLMGCGSHAGLDTEVDENGIVKGHAYAVLQVIEVDNHQFVKLRNPWGKGEWNKDWSDKSPLWTQRLKAKVGFVDDNDGAFFMSFSDFVIHFRTLYICRLFSNQWARVSTRGMWQGQSAGGCTNFDSAEHNPQYHLNVSLPTDLFVSLSQDDLRGTGREDCYIGFMILDKKGLRAKARYKGELIADSGPFSNSREVSCEVRLEPSPYPYTVFCSTFNPGEENGFSLTVFGHTENDSQHNISLTLIDPSVRAK